MMLYILNQNILSSQYIIKKQKTRNKRKMSQTNYNELQDQVQFYKIQLMEKERELSNIDAKIKKNDFKHNREVRELKNNEEKLQTTLKKQKTKYDEVNRALNQVKEHNRILQIRLTQLKEEKDKEVDNLRNMYDNLKQEVRSYERILPTHTFLKELQTSILELPTYQTIFMSWKDKKQQYDALSDKYQAFQKQSSEKMQNMTKNMEAFRNQKSEAEKDLRESTAKIIDLQSQITTFTIQERELRGELQEASNEIHILAQKLQQVNEENQILENRIEEISREYRYQLQNKEQQIRDMTQNEFKKYEDQIRELSEKFEHRQNTYLQQIAFMEEQSHDHDHKIQNQRDRFQFVFSELKTEVESLKNHLLKQKSNTEESEYLNSQLRKQIITISLENEKRQRKISQLEEELSKQKKQGAYGKKIGSDELFKAIQQLNQQKSQNEGSLSHIHNLEEQNSQIKNQLIDKDTEIMSLKIEIDDIKNKLGSEGKRIEMLTRNSLAIQLQRKSTEEQSKLKDEAIHKITMSLCEMEQKNISQEKELASLNRLIQELKKQIQIKIKEAQELDTKYKKVTENERKEKLLLTEMQKIKHQRDEIEKNLQKMEKKVDFHKISAQALKNQNLALISENKKQKELIQSKEKWIKQLEIKVKEISLNTAEINFKNQEIKRLKHRLQNEKDSYFTKQRNQKNERDGDQFKEVREKLQTEIYRLTNQNTQLRERVISFQKNQQEINNQMQKLLENKQQFQKDIHDKERQVTILQEMLERQRKDRTVRTVPSLASLHPEQQIQEQENFKEFYNLSGEKEGQIALLKRETDDLKEEIEDIKSKHTEKVQHMEVEMNEYIQEIIKMKLIVAQSEMKAAEKTYLYIQMKKKIESKGQKN